MAIQRIEALERDLASWKKGAIQRQIKLDSISAERNNKLQEVVAAKDQVVEELKTSKAARATLLEKNKKLRQEIEGTWSCQLLPLIVKGIIFEYSSSHCCCSSLLQL